jgi:hypothetical protein
LLKNLFGASFAALANRFVRQQQRRKSMKQFLILVNPFFASAQFPDLPLLNQLLDFVDVFARR